MLSLIIKGFFYCLVSFLLFLCGVFSLFIYNRLEKEDIFFEYPLSQLIYEYSWPKNNLSGEDILAGKKTKGQFTASANRLGSIGIRFNTYNKINYDLIIFRIKEKGKKDWYYQQTSRTDQIRQDVFWPFGFSPISNSEGKIYQFEIESAEGIKGDAIALNHSQKTFIANYTYPKQFLLENKLDIPYVVIKKIASGLDTQSQFVILAIGIISILAPFLHNKLKKENTSKSIVNKD